MHAQRALFLRERGGYETDERRGVNCREYILRSIFPFFSFFKKPLFAELVGKSHSDHLDRVHIRDHERDNHQQGVRGDGYDPVREHKREIGIDIGGERRSTGSEGSGAGKHVHR